MTVAADEYPGFAQLFAQTPISFDIGQTFLAVAFIDAVYRIDLQSPTGISAKITPLDKTFTIDAARKNASARYRVEFYQPGETKPFETLIGAQNFGSTEDPTADFVIDFHHPADSPQEQLETINKKMADPKTTEAERNALMLRIGQLSQQIMDEATQAFKDPAAAGAVAGMFHCGKNFYDGYLKVTGTMTLVK